jgi:hypothetical protein
MAFQSFEDLDVWKFACRLTVKLYGDLRECRDFGLKDQMTRAAVSIASNIAEGSERDTGPDFVRFLNIAKEGLNNSRPVIPAKAGIQIFQSVVEGLDPGFRRDDDLFRASLRVLPQNCAPRYISPSVLVC